MRTSKLTQEQKKECLEKINGFVKGGSTIKEACQKVKLSRYNYNNWMRSVDLKKEKQANGGENKTTKATFELQYTMDDSINISGISELEGMITERSMLMTKLDSVNKNIKNTFERIHELEKTIQL